MKIASAALFLVSILVSGILYGGYRMLFDINDQISSTYASIVRLNDPNEEALELQNLVAIISKAEPNQIESINKESIERLSMLLVDGDNVVKYYTAKALGMIGCQAEYALPSLEAALKTVPPVKSDFLPIVLSPSVSIAEEIDIAIKIIKADCAERAMVKRDGG